MINLYNGDCLEVIKEIPDNSIDCVVTDPPFGLEHDLTTDTSIEKVLEILNALKTKSKNFAIIMDYRNFWRVDQLFQDSKIGELIWEYGWVSGFKARKKIRLECDSQHNRSIRKYQRFLLCERFSYPKTKRIL